MMTLLYIILVFLFGFFSLYNYNPVIIKISFCFAVFLIITVVETKYIKLKSKLNKENNYDNLTNCYNRRNLLTELNKATNFSVLFCDLDNFKHLNDTLGHKAGDELLKQIASLWNNIKTRQKYKLFRNGGDEFVFIIYSVNKEKIRNFAEEVIDITKKQKSKYFSYVTVSIGIALSTEIKNKDKILIFADNAMYQAKMNGKNSYCFFDDKLKKEFNLTNEIREKIVSSIKNNDFEMLYQPQVNLKTGNIIGLESLIRLKNDDNKYYNSQDVINIAENDNLILDVDLVVLEKVLKETKQLIKSHPELIVSVNISGKHIATENFSEIIYNLLQKYNYPSKNLELEVTEESYVKNMKLAIDNMNRIKRYGIKFALDDFGTGYSSLKYLENFSFNIIKIDKSFVDNINNNASIVILIIGIGHELGAKLIAEGVEKETQLTTLRNLDCDIIQGFYFYKPMPIANLDRILELTKK